MKSWTILLSLFALQTVEYSFHLISLIKTPHFIRSVTSSAWHLFYMQGKNQRLLKKTKSCSLILIGCSCPKTFDFSFLTHMLFSTFQALQYFRKTVSSMNNKYARIHLNSNTFHRLNICAIPQFFFQYQIDYLL